MPAARGRPRECGNTHPRPGPHLQPASAPSATLPRATTLTWTPRRGAHGERGADRWGRRDIGGKGRGCSERGCWRLTGPGGSRAWREDARKHTGADRRGDTQTPGTDSCGDDGPRRALTWRRRLRRHPWPGCSPHAAGLPPSTGGERPAQAPRRRRRRRWRWRRRQSHGLLLRRGRAAPTDSRPLG